MTNKMLIIFGGRSIKLQRKTVKLLWSLLTLISITIAKSIASFSTSVSRHFTVLDFKAVCTVLCDQIPSLTRRIFPLQSLEGDASGFSFEL